MPSGSVTLLEASRHDDTMLANGVVEVIIQESPILRMLPQVTLTGEAYAARFEEELPDVAFRQVNANYTKTFGTHSVEYFGVAILGGEVFVDNFIVRTRPADQTKARQFRQVAKAAALTFDKYFFDGVGTADDFKGVNTLISEGFGQTMKNHATGATISLSKLDEAFDLMRTKDASAVLLNRTVRRQITAAGRDTSTGFALIDVGTDNFGRQVVSYNGTPLYIIGDDADGTQILAFDEDADGVIGGGSCTSLYIVRFGDEEDLFGLMGAGGTMDVVDFGETEASPGHLGRIEFYPGIAVLSKYAVARLTAITA